ncbi:MAG: ComEA family DNA-binding protein [Bacteroidia bacterium]
MKHHYLLLVTLFITLHSFAQLNENKPDYENFIRNHPDFQSDEMLQQDIINKIDELVAHPISINSCQIADLLQIPFVSLKDANAIVQHRQTNGLFLCREELMAVNGINTDLAKWVAQFIIVNKQIMITTASSNSFQQHQFEGSLTRIYQTKNQEAYPQQAFHDLIRMRVRLNSNWFLGMNLENDAGEVYQNFKKGVFDFKSGYLFYKGHSIIKHFVIGDYRLFYGQGLALGFGFAPGKGAQVLNTLRFNEGINKYGSFDETRFFRGTAISLDFKCFDLDLFYSSIPRDAAISNDSLQIGQMLNSGLHRTATEMERKDNVKEDVLGMRAAWKRRNWNADIVVMNRNLSPHIQTDKTKLYQYWKQNTSAYFLSSGHVKYQVNNVLMAAEIVLDNQAAYAFQFIALAALHSKLDAVLMLRNYSKDYSNPFANGFSEWGNQNEKGVYWGMVYQFNKNLSFSAYSDYYFSDWIRYRFNGQKWGMDHFFEIRYELRSGLKAGFRCKKVNTEEIIDNNLLGKEKYQLRAQLSFKLNEHLESLSRWDQNSETIQTIQGSGLVFQEFKWKQKNFQMNIRYTIFHAANSAPVLYASESELNGIFGLNTYSGNGFASFILLQTQFFKFAQLGLKLGYQESDRLNGPENEVKVQLRIRI